LPTPVGPADLTPDWLADVLGAGVTDVAVETVGTGQTGSAYRVSVSYAAPCADLPGTFIAKMGAEDREVRKRVADGYRAEVAFYRELASTLTVPVPRCYAADISEDGMDVVLLLADLSPAVQGDQLAGCSPEVLNAAAVALAGLHGPRWCDPTLRDLGIFASKPEGEAMAAGLAGILRIAVDKWLEALRPRMTEADADLLGGVPDVIRDWLVASPERFGLLHGDFRLDNLMLAPDGGVTVVDWQTITLGLPGRDLAFLVATSLEPAARREAESAAVLAYHQALGVPGYSLADCEDDYRFGQLQVPLLITLGWAFSARTPRGDDAMTTMISRSCAAIRDLKTLEAL
jgi:aminoglycoside/choline kinase family phosphotransferase